MRAPTSRRLQVESLEPRQLLAITTVDTHFDTVDPNDGLTSLREAIADSNLDPDADEIRFAPWLEGRTLRLVQGDLNITGELAIVGPGADLLTIDASGNDPTPAVNNGDGTRVFTIGNGDSDLAPQVTISGITITGGDVDGNGGAIWAEEFEAAGFATGTMTFPDQQLTAVGSVDFTIEQRESTGKLQLANGSIEITTTANGLAGGALGASGSGVNIVITNTNDDSDAISSASYNVANNEIRISADLNSNGGGVSILTVQDIGDAIAGIEVWPGTPDFTIGTVVTGSHFLVDADAGTYSDVLTGGSDSSTETISLVATGDLVTDIDITFVEQAGVGATPLRSGNALEGYTIAIDSGNTNTAVHSIATTLQHIDEIATATYAGFATFNGSLDNVPAAVTTVGGARAAGVDVITITATYPGTALNRTLSFNALNTTIGDIDVTDDGANIVVSIDSSSEYRLADIADTITTHLHGYSAAYAGDGSGTYEADRPTNNTGPTLSNVAGGADPVDGSLANAISKPLVLDQVLISDNHARGSGGGVYGLGSIKVFSSTIAGNSASGQTSETIFGGGVYAAGLIDVENSTISDNSLFASSGSGGGIYGGDILRINQSTIVYNRAQGSTTTGGGIFAPHVPVQVRGSIISENFATTSMPDIGATVIDAEYSLLGSVAGATLTGTAVQIGIDPQLLPLGDNGGPTPTHALAETSTAIDAGDPAVVAAVTTYEFDQRGSQYVGLAGHQRVISGRIDIGAVEAPVTFGDFNNDRQINGQDFLAWQRSASGVFSALDLAYWRAAYGQPATIESHVQPAAASTESVDLAIAALIAPERDAVDSDNQPIRSEWVPELRSSYATYLSNRPLQGRIVQRTTHDRFLTSDGTTADSELTAAFAHDGFEHFAPALDRVVLSR